MKDVESRCSICRSPFIGFGNNAAPVNAGRCCDDCNSFIVVPARLNPGFLAGVRKAIAEESKK